MTRRADHRTTRFRRSTVVFGCLAAAAGVLVGSGVLFAQGQSAVADQAPLSARWIERTPAVKSRSEQPRGSEDAALIYDPVRSRVILFGGKDDANLSMRETWSFDPAERKWEKVATQGRTPPPSEDHTTIYDPNGHRMIVYGGENGPTTNKVWALDLETFAWKELTGQGAPRRESHTAVYDRRGKRMVVFGGIDRTIADLYDIWTFDLDPASPTFEKWQQATLAGGRPPGRIDHAAVYDTIKNRMVVHGGWTKLREGLFGDTWAFYFGDTPGASGRWERISTATAPSARRYAVPVHDPDRNLFILLGGYGARGPLNDVWIFDLARDLWTNVTPGDGPAPVPRIDHQAVYDSKNHSVLLYGGDSLAEEAPKLRDIWELVLPPVSPLSSSRGAQ